MGEEWDKDICPCQDTLKEHTARQDRDLKTGAPTALRASVTDTKLSLWCGLKHNRFGSKRALCTSNSEATKWRLANCILNT